ncbi:MAG: hypothetical protein JOZ39_04475 [Chloroflexi bacterium]|nr:hypothetical protein [Chloroflexota bacterium]
MALRAHFDAATGLPGPRPIVSFRFYLYTDGPQPFSGLAHQILVHARVAEQSVPIGPAFLPGSHRFDRADEGQHVQVSPVLPIDFATLRWIEQQRGGRGGVTFFVDWSVLGRDERGELRNEPVTMAIGGTPFPVNLPQEVWLEILHDVRYRDVAIVEIPLAEDSASLLARSHEHLDMARERLYRADDRGVLVACGEALDVLANWRQVKLSKEYGYEDLVQDLVGPIFDSARKAERLGKVLSGVRQMCLSGKHDEASLEGRPIPVDHNDANLAFLMTSAAIAYLEQLPLEFATQQAAARSRRRRGRRGRGGGSGTSGEDAAAVETAPQPVTQVAAAPVPVNEASATERRPARRRRPRPNPDTKGSLPAA